MKRTFIKPLMLSFAMIVMVISSAFGQGHETFDNFSETESAYVDGTFTGQDGSTWTYVQCRGDYEINGSAIMIGKDRDPQSNFYSGTIANGISTMSFKYQQAFSTNVNLNVYVNDILVGNVTSSGQQGVTLESGDIVVDTDGDVVIKFMNANTSDGQVVVDDIIWNEFDYVPSQVANPTFTPGGGTYFNPVDVEIATITDGATVYYSFDSETGPWQEVTGPVNVSQSTTIWAYGEAAGIDDSEVVSADYTITSLILDKDFEDESLTSGGWTVHDVITEANTWEIETFSNNFYAQISEYQSSPELYPHSYYISPEIDLTSYNDVIFTFDSKTGYRTGDALSVHISTDYDGVGDPTLATWTELTASFDPHTGSGYGTWTNSGDIDLSAYNETAYIAFLYLSDENNEGTWQVDNIFITSPDEPISTDATLSTFTVGGLNALNLGGVVVEDPDTDPGATLFVEDFTGFEGIDVVTNHEMAVYEVTLNGTPVAEGDLATQPIALDDVIVVTVTAEDGTTVNYYKVTMAEDNREIVFVAPVGGETYETGDEVLIEWTSQDITLLDLHVYEDGNETPVMEVNDITAADGQYSFTLPNSVHGTHYFRLADSSDNSFFVESANVEFSDIVDPEIMALSPLNNAIDVSIDETLNITFSEAVFANAGNLVIYNMLDDAVIETIDVTSASVSINNDEVTITPTNPFDYLTEYYVLLDATAFVDIAGNASPAIVDNTEWSFTTEEETLPDWICNGDFETWTEGKPDCWFGTKTHTADLEVNQYSANVQSGDYAVQLITTGDSHRRFSSHAVPVENEKTYKIDFWVRGHGDIRTALFDDRDFDYGYTYNDYINVNSSDWEMYTQYVTAANTTDIAEFIFSAIDTQADLDHIQIDNVVIEEFEFDGEVATIAELSNGIIGGEYTFTGEAIITYLQSYRNQKFIQDETGAIMIDDADGIITSTYSIGDGISNITGVLDSYAGMLQFQPLADPGAPSSIGNPVIAEEMTLADVGTEDQAKLVKILEVDFQTTGNFDVGTVYDITDPSGTGVFRTNFYDADYIGSNIPTETINLVAIVTEHYDVYQLTARSSADMQPIVNVEQIQFDDINVYPNPFNDFISFNNLENVDEIILINNIGQEFDSIKISANEVNFNTSDYSAGIYFVKFVMTDGSHVTKKLIKY